MIEDKLDRIRWEITSTCNLNCKHCFIGDKLNNVDNISFAEGKKIVDKLHKLGCNKISFTAMEPLLFPKIEKLIEYCSQKNIITELVSNGTLLADINRASAVVHSGLSALYISMEGIKAETNDYIRGKGTFEKIMQALDNIKKIQMESKLVHIGIQMTINKMNYSSAKDIAAFFNSLPIDSLHIGGLSLDGNLEGNSDLMISSDTFTNSWNIIMKEYLALQSKNFNLVPKSMLPYESIYYNLFWGTDFKPIPPRCGILNKSYSLLSDAKLVPCIALLDKGFVDKIPVGSLLKEEMTFEPMYSFSKEIKSFINSKKGEDCLNCEFNNSCYPCPVTINQKDAAKTLFERCHTYKDKIDNLFDDLALNPDYFLVSLKNNVMMKESNRSIFLKKHYMNYDSYSNRFKMNKMAVHIMKDLYEKGSLNLSDLKGSNLEAINIFLRKLVINNLINVRKTVS